MNEMELKLRLLELAHAMKTASRKEEMAVFGQMAMTLGDLMSVWTGEVIRLRITAEGRPDLLDVGKLPSGAVALH